MVTPKWMMVAVLSGPYITSAEGIPAFLDGFAFTGIVNLQTVAKEWPATAGIEDRQINILEAFEASTRTERAAPLFSR